MSVQRAISEIKCAPLHSDFAREFVTRRFGKAAAEAIYGALPVFTRGKHKGQVKGFVSWLKVSVGGWQSGSPYGEYDGRKGRVLRPGTHDVQISLGYMSYTAGRLDYLCEGMKSEIQSEEEYAARCALAVAEVFKTKDQLELLAMTRAIDSDTNYRDARKATLAAKEAEHEARIAQFSNSVPSAVSSGAPPSSE